MGYNGPPPAKQVTCAVHGTECKQQKTKWCDRWSCPESECDQVTWDASIPTASQDVREAMKILVEDLKKAIVIDSHMTYVDALYDAIGVAKTATRTTVGIIREDFRTYDIKLIVGKVPLVEIVTRLKTLTTSKGVEVAREVNEYMVSCDACRKIFNYDYYRKDVNEKAGIDIQHESTKTDVWNVFFEQYNRHPFGPTIKEVLHQCKWWTDEIKYKRFLATGQRDWKQVPVQYKNGVYPMLAKYDSSDYVAAQYESLPAKKTKSKPTEKSKEQSSVIDVAPKRKFNLE